MLQAYIVARQDLTILDALAVVNFDIEQNSEFSGKSKLVLDHKPAYERGDFVFLKDSGGTFFHGLAEKVDNQNGHAEHTINLIEIENIFDRKIILSGEKVISETGIEDFIVNTIRSQFVASDDTLLNLDYITVTATTHTKVYASVSTEDGIYNFKTYLGNAREYYGIFLDFEFTGKSLAITVSKKEQELFKFDSTVSDIDNYDEVYEIDALTKLTAIWKIPDTEDENGVKKVGASTILKYYLRADRTLTTDVNDPLRAVGTEDTIYIEKDTQAEAIAEIQNEFKGNSYEHSVTAKVRRGSLVYPERLFYVGHECEIKTKSHGVRDSLITRISYKKDSEYIEVKFGKMAVTLIEKLRKERR